MTLPTGFVCHSCFQRPIVSVKPISDQEKLIIPPIASSYSSNLPYFIIHLNFNILQQFWYTPPNHVQSLLVNTIWEDSIKSTQIILHVSDINLYQRLDRAISEVLVQFKDEFEDQYHVIIRGMTHQLLRIMTREVPWEVTANVTLLIDHGCDGGLLLALEESSVDGMVPASKSSIECLEPMEVDERNSKDECLVCLDEFGEETRVLSMPCSHMFHAHCITKWLQNSHYCPLCRFEMPTD